MHGISASDSVLPTSTASSDSDPGQSNHSAPDSVLPTSTASSDSDPGPSNRPAPDSVLPTSIASSDSDPGLLNRFAPDSVLPTSIASSDSDPGLFDRSEPDSAVPMCTGASQGQSAFVMSRVDVVGYPKAADRKESTRGRKRGRSIVASSKPEMKRLREQQEPLKRMEKKKRATIAKKLFVELRDGDLASDISLHDLISENESNLEDETESEANVLKLDVVVSVSVGDYVVVEVAKNALSPTMLAE